MCKNSINKFQNYRSLRSLGRPKKSVPVWWALYAMKIRSVVILLFLLTGCASLDKSEQLLVGQWSWNISVNDGHCYDNGTLILKVNRMYSESNERGCDIALASDSFGKHRLGWYVVQNKLCFTSDKKQLKSKELTEVCKKYGYSISANELGKQVLSKQSELSGITYYVEFFKSK